jgi:hypothetical protein
MGRTWVGTWHRTGLDTGNRFLVTTCDPRPHVALSLFVGSPFFGETQTPPTPICAVFGGNQRELVRTGTIWAELPHFWDIEPKCLLGVGKPPQKKLDSA